MGEKGRGELECMKPVINIRRSITEHEETVVTRTISGQKVESRRGRGGAERGIDTVRWRNT